MKKRKYHLKKMVQWFNKLRFPPHLYAAAGRLRSRERSGFSAVQMIIGGKHSQAHHVDPCIWNTYCRGRHRVNKTRGPTEGLQKRTEERGSGASLCLGCLVLMVTNCFERERERLRGEREQTWGHRLKKRHLDSSVFIWRRSCPFLNMFLTLMHRTIWAIWQSHVCHL